MIALLLGAGVGGYTYLQAKQKKTSTGSAATAAAVAGGATWAATSIAGLLVAGLLPLIIPAALIGGGVAVGYQLAKKKEPKALGPGHE